LRRAAAAPDRTGVRECWRSGAAGRRRHGTTRAQTALLVDGVRASVERVVHRIENLVDENRAVLVRISGLTRGDAGGTERDVYDGEDLVDRYVAGAVTIPRAGRRRETRHGQRRLQQDARKYHHPDASQ